MEKIDFVVTWVDGKDPLWQEEREKYAPKEDIREKEINRFRDWDLMRYWFRGVETFAPWVNCVYFITWGHTPDWLNCDHPKLKIVKHTDYIPEAYLPTYNSNVIEMNIHRIPELSEQFVLFNDDIFLTNNVKPEDFFVNGLPCEAALLGQLSAVAPEHRDFPGMLMNNMSIVNKYFSKKEVLRKHWRKFYSLKYGKHLLRNLLLTPGDYFSRFHDDHLTAPYLKSSFAEIWEKEPGILDTASRSRFRSRDDVSHWTVKAWQCCKGSFVPRSPGFGRSSVITDESAWRDIESQRYKVITLNDGSADVAFETVRENVARAFEKILPNPSSFEKI